MKTILAIAVLFISVSVNADPACSALSKYVGNYKHVDESCPGPLGDTMTVAPYTDGEDSGFAMTSDGITIGASLSEDAMDKCHVSENKVVLETCRLARTCLPHWYYTFSDNTVTFQANGCTVQYQKTN